MNHDAISVQICLSAGLSEQQADALLTRLSSGSIARTTATPITLSYHHPSGELMQQLQLPPLATDEVYVGAVGDKQGSLYHLVLLPGDSDDAPLAKQLEWAKSIGGDLPTRVEQAMLWAGFRDQFQKDWYWSNELHHADSSCAWYQSFDNGGRGNDDVSAELRARAVRRLPI